MRLETALAFDRFVLDPVAGGLYAGSGAVPLTPKAYALLEYFVANAGRLVSKRELLDALWPRAYVADGVLKVCVREIRRALDDDARAPRFIETAHRRGYRFISATTAVAPAGRLAIRPPVGSLVRIVRVPISTGNSLPGAGDDRSREVVVMGDFIFSELQPAP